MRYIYDGRLFAVDTPGGRERGDVGEKRNDWRDMSAVNDTPTTEEDVLGAAGVQQQRRGWMVTACDEVFRWRCGNSGRRIAKEQQQMGTIRNVGSHLNTFQFIFLHEISWLVDVYCECVVTFGLCCSSWQQRRGKERIYPVAKGRQLTGRPFIYNNILSDMRESRWCTNCEIGKARWNKG